MVLPISCPPSVIGGAFDWSLDWGKAAAVVGVGVSVVALWLMYRQVLEARRTFEGQTFLALTLQIQDERVRAARGRLYELVEGGASGNALLQHAAEIEPALQILDVLATMLDAQMLPRQPLMSNWGGMIARCWQAGEPFVRARRAREGRADLWQGFERLALEAVRLEDAKRK